MTSSAFGIYVRMEVYLQIADYIVYMIILYQWIRIILTIECRMFIERKGWIHMKKRLLALLMAATVMGSDGTVVFATQQTNGEQMMELVASGNQSVETATEILSGSGATGTLEEDVEYYYALTADGLDAFYYMDITNLAESGRLNYELFTDATMTERVKSGHLGEKDILNAQLGKVEQNTTYYLKISGDAGVDYEIRFDKKEDDKADAIGKATEVAIGGEIEGALEDKTDYEYFAITADATDSFYYLSLANLAESGSLDYVLYTDETMTKEVKTTNGGNISWYLNSKDTLYAHLGKMEPGTTYYLKLSGDAGVEYKVGFEKKEDDRADALDAATTVALGGTQTGVTEDGVDCEYFTLTSDSSDAFYYFSLSNLATTGRVYYTLYTDETLTKVAKTTNGSSVSDSLNAKGSFSKHLGKIEAGKTYYLKITGDKDVEYSIGFSKKQDDRPDTVEHATKLAIGGTVSGTLEDDVDCEYFTITSDDSEAYYFLEMTNLATEGRVYYTLYTDSTLTQVAKTTTGSDISWYVGAKGNEYAHLGKIEKGKTYYLKITGSAGVTYRFSASKIKDDYRDTSETATAMVQGQLLNGTIEDGIDTDYFIFTTDGSQNAYYYIEMTNLASDGRLNYTLYENTDCVKVMKDKKNDGNHDIDWYVGSKSVTRDCLGILSGKQTLCLKISGSEGVKYTLKITKSNDVIGNTAGSAKKLKITGGADSYNLESYEDVDFFKFTTTSLANHTFTFKNVSNPNNMRVQIYNKKNCADSACVYDAWCEKGKKLSVSKTNTGKKISKNTTYYVKITGSFDGTYTVEAKAKAPSGFKAKAAGGKKATLSWKKDSSAKGYYIYRAASKNGKYKKIAQIKRNATVKYTDKKLKKGSVYYYKIAAYGKRGTSAYTSAKKVKVK